MNAIVSGSAGRAIVIEGSRWQLLSSDALGAPAEVAAINPRAVFGGARDLRFLVGVSLDEVRRHLTNDSSADDALHLALLLLDSTVSSNARCDASDALEEMLSPEVDARLEAVLHAAPLPASFDLLGARACCPQTGTRTPVLLQRLEERQPAIERVRGAWDSIPDEHFRDAESRGYARAAAVREGAFRDLVDRVHSGASVDPFLFKFLSNESFKAIGGYREVLQLWAAPFKSERKIAVDFERDDLAEEFRDSGGRKPRRSAIDLAATRRRVDAQKLAIREAMAAHDIPRAVQYADELVDYQRQSGGGQYAAKSLCDLAMEAQRRGIGTLQLRFTESSVELSPGDPWAWAQYGNALLSRGRLDAASRAYERSLALSPGVVARTGRAEVLKAQNRLADALAAYDETLHLHPENVVARNGRAEVLKAQNRLADALAAYDEILRLHPEDVFARNGRAGVLKALNRFADALAAYDETLRLHPENVVARNGRAEVLKAQNRLADALAAYDEILGLHPEDVVARTGRAEVLKAQNRLADALAAYDEILRLHPENVFARTGRAEVLKAQNRLADALAAYDETLRLHPENVFARTGRAEVLKAQNRLADALAAYDETLHLHPENVVARNGRAEVLKAQNRLADALAAYDEILGLHPEDVVTRNGRAEVLKAQNRLADALAAYDEILGLHPEDVVARNGRAEVLKTQNRLADALAAYDETLRLHPENLVARSGRAGVLVVMGRFDDALALLPQAPPVTRHDWIAFHIRGVVLLRQKKLDEAIAIFEMGARENPRPADRDYFRTGLATALLRRSRFLEASRVLGEVKLPEIQLQTDVLRLHALGAAGQRTAALAIHRTLPMTKSGLLVELTDELRSRFIELRAPRHDDDWLLDREATLLVAA